MVVHADEAFLKATYNLEGDGPPVLKGFNVLSTLTAGIQVGCYPNVMAIVQSLSPESPAVLQQWVDYAKSYVIPSLQYFLDKFSKELRGSVPAFKAARLFLPKKVREINPDASVVDLLQAFPFFTPSVLRNGVTSTKKAITWDIISHLLHQ